MAGALLGTGLRMAGQRFLGGMGKVMPSQPAGWAMSAGPDAVIALSGALMAPEDTPLERRLAIFGSDFAGNMALSFGGRALGRRLAMGGATQGLRQADRLMRPGAGVAGPRMAPETARMESQHLRRQARDRLASAAGIGEMAVQFGGGSFLRNPILMGEFDRAASQQQQLMDAQTQQALQEAYALGMQQTTPALQATGVGNVLGSTYGFLSPLLYGGGG